METEERWHFGNFHQNTWAHGKDLSNPFQSFATLTFHTMANHSAQVLHMKKFRASHTFLLQSHTPSPSHVSSSIFLSLFVHHPSHIDDVVQPKLGHCSDRWWHGETETNNAEAIDGVEYVRWNGEEMWTGKVRYLGWVELIGPGRGLSA